MAETLAPGGSSRTMQAIAVVPGKANSIHLRNDARRPAVADFPEGRGVLVEVIRVGVDGTDREIAYAEFGEAPEGDDHLIIGHESLGRIVEAGSDVPAWATPGSLVVATVRRPGSSIYDAIGFPDFTTDDVVYERGIRRLHGFLAEWYAEDVTFLVPIPESLEPVAVLMEPFSVVEKGIRQAFEIQRRLHVWQPRRAAVLGAGSIGMLAALALRLRGLDVVVYSRREPPYLNSELLARIGARYVGSGQTTLEQLAEQHGPFDLALEATGFSPLAIEAGSILARNGVLVLTGVTGGDHRADIPTDRLNQGFVLGNKVMVGTVNAARDDFVTGVADMLRAEATYPGWLGRLLTTPIKGLAGYQEMLDRLEHDEEAIKVFVEVARYRRSGG
jgi:threonine dehydrogenase-like Zn-dependent dehydrogenase